MFPILFVEKLDEERNNCLVAVLLFNSNIYLYIPLGCQKEPGYPHRLCTRFVCHYYMNFSLQKDVPLKQSTLQATYFMYMGSWLTPTNTDLKTKNVLPWKVIGKLSHIWRYVLPRKIQSIPDSSGNTSQTGVSWTLTKQLEARLDEYYALFSNSID